MTKNQFIFKKENRDNWKSIAVECYRSIQSCLSGSKEFLIEIKPYSKRSYNALSAYWCLLKTIEDWHKKISVETGDNPQPKEVWSEWFKRDIGLLKEVDNLPFWKKKYKGVEFFCNTDGEYYFFKDGKKNELGKRIVKDARSLSNIGDVTKDEMERLINCVLKFGAENDIENCIILDQELENLLKKSKWKSD
jgi:hypothetical protein